MRKYALLIIIYLAFISLGLPDGIFGIAWPTMRMDLGVDIEAAGLITILLLGFISASSFLSGKLINRFGTATITIVSTFFTAIALIAFGFTKSYYALLILTIPLGLGQGGVDAGLNNYVANNYSSTHMNWLHSFWGVGATIGPMIMTATLVSNESWRSGYFKIGAIQFVLFVIILLSIKLWKKEDTHVIEEENQTQAHVNNRFLAGLSVSTFFLYCAAEYSIAVWFYSLLVEELRIAPSVAGAMVSSYYGAIMIGRFISGIIATKLSSKLLIRSGILLSITGLTLMLLVPTQWFLHIGIIMIGLGFAPIYPTMMHETPKRFEAHVSNQLIGYQGAAASLGASTISALFGVLFGLFSLQIFLPGIFIILIVLYFVTEKIHKIIHN